MCGEPYVAYHKVLNINNYVCIAPPELCCMNVRLMHELRQDQNTYFHGAAVRVGNNVSEVTHLVPVQCRHPTRESWLASLFYNEGKALVGVGGGRVN